MEIFTGNPTKTTDFSPEPIKLKLNIVQPQPLNELLRANLNNSPLSYPLNADLLPISSLIFLWV